MHFQVKTIILQRYKRVPVLGHWEEKSADMSPCSVRNVRDHAEVLVGSEANFVVFFRLTCLCLSVHNIHSPSAVIVMLKTCDALNHSRVPSLAR